MNRKRGTVATGFLKHGSGNRIERENANGIPGAALDNASSVGLTRTPESEAFGIGWDAGFSACVDWYERRRMNGPMNEPPAPMNPVKRTR